MFDADQRTHLLSYDCLFLRLLFHIAGRFWNRDLNAARNIGWVYIGVWLHGVRPVHLRRPSGPVSAASAGEASLLHPVSPPSTKSTASRKRKQAPASTTSPSSPSSEALSIL
jgi:hypothetical protein